MRLVQVAVPVPKLDALTYALPDHCPELRAGMRVRVPLGNRVVTGCVVSAGGSPLSADRLPLTADRSPNSLLAELPASGERPADSEDRPAASGEPFDSRDRGLAQDRRSADSVRDIIDILDDEPFLPPDVLQLVAWVAEYYACGLGEALAVAMPPRALAGDAVAAAFRTIRIATVTAQGHEATGGMRLGPQQREVLALLKGAPDGLATGDLDRRGFNSATLTRLAALGLISLSQQRVERDPFEQGRAALAATSRPGHTLTGEQDAALTRLRALADAGSFQASLLHGVTGSGKTEVYLRLTEHVRSRGRSALLLVPEIALTPAVAGAFRSRFGERVAIQHSGLSGGERHDQWHRIRRGDIDVVVGTRSAVFAPLARPGLIIVDEEHDGSYKQDESPRYHGRDVAVVRAQQAGALVVLGSATPSMESFHNAQSGRYALVTMASRVLERPLAAVTIVDMRQEYAAGGADVILSAPLRDALTARVAAGEQAIVLLNRRGFATVVFCRECTATLECPNCSVSLTVHRAARRARCHYCNYAIGLPKACLNCRGPFLEQLGFGTERVEAEIRDHLPEARVARVDRDTMRRRGAITSLLGSFGAGQIDVLVGTQMLAKGHDFPNVTLVGVISADVGLGMADFRAAERTFQLLTQVAGRAGRGNAPGEAIVQTLYPRHYSIRHACRQDYGAFFAEEISYRRAMRYPPAVSLINVIVKARTRELAMDDARGLVAALGTHGPFSVLGPAPAPLNKLKGEHRAQFFVKGTQRAAMRQAVLAAVAARPELGRRTLVDVDPLTVL